MKGGTAPVRPRRRRRGAGPLADAAAHARAPRPPPLDDRARRPRAGDRPRVARRAGTRRSRTSAGPRTRSPPSSRWATGCPGAFLALANRLLAVAAPGVAPSRSVRPDGDPPDLHRVAPDELVDAGRRARGRARRGARDGRGDRDARARRRAARRARSARRRARRAGRGRCPTARSSSCPRALAKGLEFDGVIVVEPAEIAASGPHGVRLLFVALTRAVQHLAIAHAAELPPELVEPRRRLRRP